jgi:hypothetical protein
MATRDELVVALAARYQSSNRDERGRILDEFTEISGLHRKLAMRLLRAGQANRRSGPRPSRCLYDEAVRVALIGHCHVNFRGLTRAARTNAAPSTQRTGRTSPAAKR